MKQRVVSREDVGPFSLLLAGYIGYHFLKDSRPITDEDIDKIHDFICRRIGMYLPITVE